MQPADVSRFRNLSDPHLHPDGVQVAFVVSQMDLEEDRYDRQIWLWDGSAARQLTSGPADTRPRWSPSGDRLLFLRKGTAEETKPQVAVLPMAGGDPKIVTDMALGVTEAEWSPHGDTIGFVAARWIDEVADLDDDERKRRPRRITQVPYRVDNVGWINDLRTHVYTISATGDDEPECLTAGDWYDEAIVWSPNGAQIAFTSARHESRELDAGNQVFTVPVSGGDATAQTAVGTWSDPSFDTQGRLHAIGSPETLTWPDVPPLRRLGDGVDLTGHLDRAITTLAPTVTPAGPQWLDDGGAWLTVEDSGGVRVDRLHPNGTTTRLLGGERPVTGIAGRGDGTAFAFIGVAPTDPGELYWWEDGQETKLTSLNETFRSEVELAAPQRFTIAHDGVEIDGWIYLPPGDERVPVLFNIHGGPASQYGYGFFDEFQVYVGAGYGVVATNPRGSSGYGLKHVRAVVGEWGRPMAPDLVDLLAAVDVAGSAEPRLDLDRVAIMGGSYGGLMTAVVTAHDSRYKSAVAERGLYSWPSFNGTSDIGMFFSDMYLARGAGRDYETLWAASPLRLVDQIETPTLVIHSETDWRTPIEQGEQLFAALKLRGVPTEFIRFPAGESHELSRSGSPKHRIERFEAILEWHGRYLRNAASSPRGDVAN